MNEDWKSRFAISNQGDAAQSSMGAKFYPLSLHLHRGSLCVTYSCNDWTAAIMLFEPRNLQHNWPFVQAAIKVKESRVYEARICGSENAVSAMCMAEHMKNGLHSQYRVTQLAITRRTRILFRQVKQPEWRPVGDYYVRVGGDAAISPNPVHCVAPTECAPVMLRQRRSPNLGGTHDYGLI
jgi:hypothetical protein